MRRILVTGSNGLLGQKLTSLFDGDESVELIASARTPLRLPLVRGKFTELDIADEAEVKAVIEGLRPDVVINTAAMTQVDQCESNPADARLANTTSVEYLIRSSEKAGSQFIQLSTDFVFDGTQGPLDETAIPNPVNLYGRTKLDAEQAIMNSKLRWTIIRTVLVYGVTPDHSRSNIVLWVKKSLEDGKPISVVNDQWRTPTLAEDLASGCVLAAMKGRQGVFHISGDEMMTPYQLAIQTANHFKLNKELLSETTSAELNQPARRPAKTGFIIEKARRELGYSPRSFGEGLAIVAAQLKAPTAPGLQRAGKS